MREWLGESIEFLSLRVGWFHGRNLYLCAWIDVDLWLSVCCDCLVMCVYRHKDEEATKFRRCCLFEVWI